MNTVVRAAVAVLALACIGEAAQAAPASEASAVSFDHAEVRLRPGQTWGASLKGADCSQPEKLVWAGGKRAIENDSLAKLFRAQMTAAGVTLAAGSGGLFDTLAAAGEYQVSAAITKVDAELCAPKSPPQVRGAVAMSVEWRIYGTSERRAVATLQTSATAQDATARAGNGQKLLDAAFAENVKGLIASKVFRALVAVPETAPEIAAKPKRKRAPAKPRSDVAAISTAVESVVAILNPKGFGSGVLVGADGYVVTNSHVVGASKTVTVRWADGGETEGQVLRNDRDRDLALIKTERHGTPPLKLRAVSPPIGSTIYAVGMPLDEKFQGTVTKGIVSANRTLDGQDFIQGDVTINPGNSGGPLLDEAGNVIGLTVAGYRVKAAPTGINLFIPAKDVAAFLAPDVRQ